MKTKLLALALSAALLLSGCTGSVSENDASKAEPSSQSESTVTSESRTVTSAESAAQSTSASSSASQSETTAAASSASAASSAEPAATTSTAQTTTSASSQRPAATNDKTKPVVFYNGYVSYHLLGKAFDLNNYVSYGDDTDRHPKLTYTGTVDPNKAGSYPIKATVTDASGSSTSWELTVKVVGSVPSQPSPYIPSMPFSTFVSKHKAANTRFGLDVSQFQGSIDFKAVKNAGCSFVFIRVGTKLGGFSLDTYFKKNLDNAIAAGLDVGIYLYTSDHTDAAARDSARWIVSQLGGRKLTLPVAFDWEELDSFQSLGASTNDINSAYAAFKDELSKSGYGAMIYTSAESVDKLWSEQTRSTNPIWLAQYTEKPTYTGNFGVWQACYGSIPGISVVADFNVLYTDKKYK